MNRGIKRSVDILLVEDNYGDARLAEEALRENRFKNRLHHVENGVEAMSFLMQEGKYRDVPVPDLMLLDLNMPKMDGREVLERVKHNERLMRIPVVVLTVSSAEEDICRSYDLHANCYLTKPIDLDEFMDVIRHVNKFWLETAKLPPK